MQGFYSFPSGPGGRIRTMGKSDCHPCKSGLARALQNELGSLSASWVPICADDPLTESAPALSEDVLDSCLLVPPTLWAELVLIELEWEECVFLALFPKLSLIWFQSFLVACRWGGFISPLIRKSLAFHPSRIWKPGSSLCLYAFLFNHPFSHSEQSLLCPHTS